MQSKLNEILPVLNEHIERFRGFGARDAYKLLYQACLGPEHLIDNENEAREWFDKEFEQTEPDNSVPLIEELTEDVSVMRLNFANAKALNLNRELLFSAFIQSAEEFEGGINSFLDCWQELMRMSMESQIALDIEDMRQVDNLARKQGFPPMRHSEEYRGINKPAYRVVLSSVLFRIFDEMRDRLLEEEV